MFWKMGVLEILKRNKITQGLGMPVGGGGGGALFWEGCRLPACGFAREWAALQFQYCIYTWRSISLILISLNFTPNN